MGFRTVVTFNNDYLNREDFLRNAERLYDMIISNGRTSCPGAEVVEQVHNDVVTLRIHGGGSGLDMQVACASWSTPDLQATLLKRFAENLGYKTIRNSKG